MHREALMLPSVHRLRSSADFAAVIRRGHRAGRGSIVMHLGPARGSIADPVRPARFGLVVGKSVGNSVVRHRVSRRLRAQLAQRVGAFPAGRDVVVRAQPAAAAADSAALGADLDRAMHRLLGRSARAAAR